MQAIDIDLVYNALIEKLRKFDFPDVVTEIEKSSAGAATGSEALVSQGSYLLSLRQTNPIVFELIKEQIKDYIKYCNQHGLVFKQ